MRRPPGPVSSGWGVGALSFVSGRGRGIKSLNPGRARASEVSAFLGGGAVGVGRELGQAGLLGPGVVGEDRVLAGGAGGAAGVQVTLVQRHGQLQVLLKGERPLTSDPQTRSVCPRPGDHPLTWLDVMARQRSRSSTSCLKVGLWEGMACQQSLIIMYLKQNRGSAPGSEPSWLRPRRHLTARWCTWRACPCGDLPSAA